jgi:release factor glutamine methyltransferase
MRLIDLLNTGAERLRVGGVEEFELDARILLEYCTGKTRTEIFLEGDKQAPSKDVAQFFDLIRRRSRREPVAYIIGEQEFWSLPFIVSPDVLIPRPETEFLIERILAQTDPENLASGKILDLCCGSGVIGIVLALETGKRVTVADISSRALDVCRKNVEKHAIEDRIDMVQSDLFERFGVDGIFSLVVSNPPYVERFELDNNLEPEVSSNEPRLALDGGESGLEIIKRIRLSLPGVLQKNGQFFMEFGAGQGAAVLDLFLNPYRGVPPFSRAEIFKDYTGRDRVLAARF